MPERIDWQAKALRAMGWQPELVNRKIWPTALDGGNRQM